MIYIWDNGLDYADHQLVFIEAPPDSRRLIEALGRVYHYGARDSRVIARTGNMIWHHGDGAVSLRDFADDTFSIIEHLLEDSGEAPSTYDRILAIRYQLTISSSPNPELQAALDELERRHQ